MIRTHPASVLVLCFVACSCAAGCARERVAEKRPLGPTFGTSSVLVSDDERDDDSAWPEQHLSIGGFWVPGLKVKADEDEHEPGLGLEFDADLNHGKGWGARVAVAGEEGRTSSSLGVTYLTSVHTERDTRRHARAHQAYLEWVIRSPSRGKSVVPTFLVGAGVGGAVFDFAERFDDAGGAAGMIRGEAGVRIAQRLDLVIGGGGFLWGYPGETIGYGGFWSLGGYLRF